MRIAKVQVVLLAGILLGTWYSTRVGFIIAERVFELCYVAKAWVHPYNLQNFERRRE